MTATMEQPRTRKHSVDVSVKPLLVSAKDAARVLGISRTKTYELINQGMLPVIKIGGVKRIPVKSLEEWVDAQIVNSGMEAD